MPSSVFMRPRARAAMSSVSQQQVFREVHTEDELRAAVSAENTGSYIFGLTGRRVVIASSISIKNPIKISAHGIIIESHGRIPIFPASDSMDCIFDVTSAVNVLIRNLSFVNTLPVQDPSYCIRSGALTSIQDCSFTTGAVPILCGTDCIIKGNLVFYGSTRSVLVSGNSSIITSNIIAYGLSVDSSFGNNVILGNMFSGSNIDTSLSAGNNSIVGNTNVGTITNSATDAVTSNT